MVEGVLHHPPCLVKPVCQDGGGMEWMQYVSVLFTGVGFIYVNNEHGAV